MRTASQFPRSQYVIGGQPSASVDDPLNRDAVCELMGEASNAVLVLQAQAVLASEDRRADASVTAIQCLVSLALSFQQEADRSFQWFSKEILSVACRTAERLVCQNQLTSDQLGSLQRAFKAIQAPCPVTKSLVISRCHGIYLYENWAKCMVPLLTSYADGETLLGKKHVRIFDGGIAGNRDADFLYYLETVEQLIAASQQPFPERLQTALGVRSAVQKKITENGSHLISYSAVELPQMIDAVLKTAESLAFARITETAMAMERHRLSHAGEVPASLAALVPDCLDAVPTDPYDGKPLRLKLLPKGYAIFSIGLDQQNGVKNEDRVTKKRLEDPNPIFSVCW